MKYFTSSEALVNCLPCIYINLIASPHDYRFCCFHDGNFCLLKKNILQNIFISRAKLYSCSKGEANRHFMQWKGNWQSMQCETNWNEMKWTNWQFFKYITQHVPLSSFLYYNLTTPTPSIERTPISISCCCAEHLWGFEPWDLHQHTESMQCESTWQPMQSTMWIKLTVNALWIKLTPQFDILTFLLYTCSLPSNWPMERKHQAWLVHSGHLQQHP